MIARIDEFSPQARQWWEDAYPRLTRPRPGRIGSATQRAAAHVRRLTLLYAVLDGATIVQVDHLAAANAVWEYAEESARFVFGASALSDKAKHLDAALTSAGPAGIDRTSIRDDVFGSHNISAPQIEAVLVELRDAGLAFENRESTKGRPRSVWISRQYGHYGQ